jgi:hypothetical protein
MALIDDDDRRLYSGGPGPFEEDYGATSPAVVNANAGPNESPFLPPNPEAPAFGKPSLNEQQIRDTYATALPGHVLSSDELRSELENANKYGATGIRNSIAARSNNTPGSGAPGTATWADVAAATKTPGTRTTNGAPVSGPYQSGFSSPYGSGSQYDDPASMLAEQYAMHRLGQRTNPDPNSGTGLYETFAKHFSELLQKPVFSDAEEHALKVKAFDQLESMKSTEMQQKADELGRRRIPPSSGVYLSEMNRIRDKWDKLAAGNQNELTTSAIGERQRRLTQALSVLAQLQGSEEGRFDAGLALSMVPLGMQNAAFGRLVNATNLGSGGAASSTSGLLQLLNLVQQQSNFNTAGQSASLGNLMEVLGYLFPEAA